MKLNSTAAGDIAYVHSTVVLLFPFPFQFCFSNIQHVAVPDKCSNETKCSGAEQP